MIPIYAHGFFNVCRDGSVTQLIIFEYLDPGMEYFKLVRSKRGYAKELATLRRNMQLFLDAEDVRINNERVYPRVVSVDIGFSGSKDRPYIKYLVRFKGKLINGDNIYEDSYESEVAEYDYVVTWVFPEGSSIIKVDVGYEYKVVNNNILTFFVPEGSETPGYESIVFRLSSV